MGARGDVAQTSPLVHFRYTNLISLGSNLGNMVRWLVSDKPGFQRTKENCTLASFKPNLNESHLKIF